MNLGKRHGTKAKAGNAEPAGRLNLTEVRGVAAPDIPMFGCGGLKLESLAT